VKFGPAVLEDLYYVIDSHSGVIERIGGARETSVRK